MSEQQTFTAGAESYGIASAKLNRKANVKHDAVW